MLNPDLREIMKQDISRYSLVIGTAKRAREIAQNAEESGEPLIEKPVSLAMEELLENKISIVEPK